ncbi:MAG: OmpA family protein [Myxococcota bacterium]
MLRHTLTATLLLLPFTALAEDDDPEAKENKDIQRFPGFYLADGSEEEFARFEFLVGYDTYENKEGKRWHTELRLSEGARQPGAIEVLRNFENAFKKKGGKAVYKYDDGTSGTFTLKMPLGKSERWMQIQASPGAYVLDIVDVKAMEQQVEVSASETLDALNKDGFIALHGILFDTGKDTIKAESEPLLDEIVSPPTNNPSLTLSVEGHTDNVGKPKANLDLSQKRAASVKKYLVGKGVDAKRLTTKGWGDTKPVADNRTEDGRAKNRRVELVKQ